jgi:hypothetical protein
MHNVGCLKLILLSSLADWLSLYTRILFSGTNAESKNRTLVYIFKSTITWRGSRSISRNVFVLHIPHTVDNACSTNNPNYMESSYRGGPGSIPGQPIWELCRTKWNCFFPSISVSPISYRPTKIFVLWSSLRGRYSWPQRPQYKGPQSHFIETLNEDAMEWNLPETLTGALQVDALHSDGSWESAIESLLTRRWTVFWAILRRSRMSQTI